MTEDLQTFEMPHQLTYYEESANGRPTLRSLLALGILVSEHQSTAMGVGEEVTGPRHLGWVVTEYSGHISSCSPKNGEQVVLGCKAVAYNRLLAEREFWVRSQGGEEYARFRGLFVMFDIKARKMVSIPHDLVAPYQMPTQLRLPKIKRPARFQESTDTRTRQYRVRFFDIDLNRHVNNAVYSDWMMDPLGADFLMSHRLTDFAIRYEHEVRYGQEIESRFNSVSDSTTLHQIRIGQTTAATAQFDWAALR